MLWSVLREESRGLMGAMNTSLGKDLVDLVAGKTVVTAKGDGPTVDVSAAGSRVFLLTLDITNIIEQESLDVSVYGSADGAVWSPKSIVAFPQKFYREQSVLLLDLTAHPDVKFVR